MNNRNERVAKAIAEHMFPERTWPDDFDEYLLKQYRDCARQVITALLLPLPEPRPPIYPSEWTE